MKFHDTSMRKTTLPLTLVVVVLLLWAQESCDWCLSSLGYRRQQESRKEYESER